MVIAWNPSWQHPVQQPHRHTTVTHLKHLDNVECPFIADVISPQIEISDCVVDLDWQDNKQRVGGWTQGGIKM